jgi:hypothetical protein
MRELYTSMDSTRIGFYKSVLDEAGIACYIQNETTSHLVNMIAMVFQPTLCIVDDDCYDEAVALLSPFQKPSSSEQQREWQCPNCQELNPASFECCWQCQNSRPDSP